MGCLLDPGQASPCRGRFDEQGRRGPLPQSDAELADALEAGLDRGESMSGVGRVRRRR